MKTITLNVLKKNRAYFKCENSTGYAVKLKIDKNSENLELGEQELLVNDVSVRTKYGTDIIYELVAETKNTGFVTMKHFKFNEWLVKRSKELGGKWDSEAQAWVFSSIVENEVEELEEIYNSELVNVEVKALQEIFKLRDSIDFLGYTLCKASGRDSGAIIYEDICLISGECTSNGSMKNWYTSITEESVLRLSVPKKLLEKYIDQYSEEYQITVL